MKYYYELDTDLNIIAVHTDYESNKHKRLVGSLYNMPKENCVILNGQLYDKTTPAYTKAKQLFDIEQELQAGYTFDGKIYSLDDKSMMQYTMMKSLEHDDPKEPVEVRDINGAKVFLSMAKYIALCNPIGRKYKTLINTYEDVLAQ